MYRHRYKLKNRINYRPAGCINIHQLHTHQSTINISFKSDQITDKLICLKCQNLQNCMQFFMDTEFKMCSLPPGGALNFFSGRGVRPGFPKCGACELTFASEKGGLWAENFRIWGLVNWKFPNLGACERKISKFGGLWAQIWVKIEAEAKISKFSQKGVLWTDSFAWNGTLASGRRGVKRGSSGPHIPIPPF